jgi:PAS domain S-box-containing protein
MQTLDKDSSIHQAEFEQPQERGDLEAVVDGLPHGVAIIREQQVKFANHYLLKLLGRSADDSRQFPLEELISRLGLSGQPEVFELVSEAPDGSAQPISRDFFLLDESGHPRRYHLVAAASLGVVNPAVHVSIYDVSEPHPAEDHSFPRDTGRETSYQDLVGKSAANSPEYLYLFDELEVHISNLGEAKKLQDAIYRISESVNLAEDLNSLFGLIHEVVASLMQAENLFVALYDEPLQIIDFAYNVDEADPDVAIGPFSVEELGNCLTVYLITHGQPLLLSPDEFDRLVERENIQYIGTKSEYWLGVPLKTKDRTIGALVIQTYHPGVVYGEKEKELLAFVSHQIAMAIQRKQKEDALRKNEELFRKYFENTLIGAAITTVDMKWMAANDRLCAMLGYPLPELTQLTWTELTPPEDLALELGRFQRVVDGEADAKPIEKRYICKDGKIIDAVVSTVCVRKEDGTVDYFMSLLEDITERKDRERERDAVDKISAALRQSANRMEMIPVLVDEITRFVHAGGVVFASRDSQNGTINLEMCSGWWRGLSGVRLPTGIGPTGAVFKTGIALTPENFCHENHSFLPPIPQDAQGVLCLPLVVEGQVQWAIWVARMNRFSSQEIRLITSVADIATNALHRTTLHEQTLKTNRKLNALHQIDNAINSTQDLTKTLDIVLSVVKGELGADAADILLLNPYSSTLNYSRGAGFHSNFVEHTHLTLGESLAGKAASERHRVSVLELQSEHDLSFRSLLLADEGFTAYHAEPLVAKGELIGVLEVFLRSPHHPEDEWYDFLEILAGQAAIAIDNKKLFENLKRTNVELEQAYDSTIETIANIWGKKYGETKDHSRRVVDLTENLAREVGVALEDIKHYRRGAFLHDIGKIQIPDEILFKQGSLTADEWKVMKLHPQYAYQALKDIHYLRPALDIPYYHHEKWDGSGYPNGLSRESIPLAARIFAICDVWDALGEDRPYRKGWDVGQRIEYMRVQSGIHFDPWILDCFFKILNQRPAG